MSDVDHDLLSQFTVEIRQHLVAIEQHLGMADVADVTDTDVDVVFRAFHSIKALARVIGAKGAEELVHEAESLLSPVRAGDHVLAPSVQQALIAATDALQDGLHAPLSWTAPSSLIDELRHAATLAERDGAASLPTLSGGEPGR